MSRKHSEAEIIEALKQLESGCTVKELAYQLGVTPATVYSWRWKRKKRANEKPPVKSKHPDFWERNQLTLVKTEECLERVVFFEPVTEWPGWRYILACGHERSAMSPPQLDEEVICVDCWVGWCETGSRPQVAVSEGWRRILAPPPVDSWDLEEKP